MITSYICIDLETTGLNPKRDKIIEIGALKVVNGVKVDSFSTLVRPGRRLEERIVELTGIRDEDLRDAPVINQVFGELTAFMEAYPILGHSILSDYCFLKKAAVDMRLEFEKEGLDTLRLARRYLPELESRSLESLCRHFAIPHRPHRALADAEATVKLYQALCESFYQEDPIFQPVPLKCKLKRDQPATDRQKERLRELLGRLQLTTDLEIESLSRSEASRLTDKLLSRRELPNGQRTGLDSIL